MVLTKTPICNFGEKPHSFKLKGVNNKLYKFEDCLGKNGTLVMFICNHCPYVRAVIEDIVNDTNNLKNQGIKTVAIMSNDTKNYPDDSFDKMAEFSKTNKFEFPYLIDESQNVAKKYGAVCTPDFFGYNNKLELQYRGRIRELKNLKPINTGESDLFKAMTMIVKTGKGPKNQIPSMGCNIKWAK
ncbi:MAG: thioredoxin family protein [Candidatus Marinimicrobia bacterium]|nr:thioredoxin family protein [Candidatus Neomarinimicrobiota bacterium]RPG05244.1 MAG: thioredoxin family protein [Pelagibacteraceae bacterium TMED247]|tara:strand:+ start:10 stop:564 length:555 start_codon:yes stop_codon:yes gene_type:complete